MKRLLQCVENHWETHKTKIYDKSNLHGTAMRDLRDKFKFRVHLYYSSVLHNDMKINPLSRITLSIENDLTRHNTKKRGAWALLFLLTAHKHVKKIKKELLHFNFLTTLELPREITTRRFTHTSKSCVTRLV